MNTQPTVSFSRIALAVLGYLGGGGWHPGTSQEGIGPFERTTSDAGAVVSPGTAMQLAAAWACVKLISETVATLPLVLKAPDANGKLVAQTSSATYRMLRLSPNAYMTAVEFWEMMVASLCLWGNAFARKIRVAGRVVSLEPLRPESMTVYRHNAEIRYGYMRGVVVEDYSADEMLHIKGFGVDGLIGLAPVAMARQTIGRSIATDEASGSVFKSGLSASGFIQYTKAFPTPEQREDVRLQIANFTGSANAGKVMVLENGMTYQAITMNPADAQLLESRQFNVEEICRWFGVPPQLIGHMDKASSWASSLEGMTLGWLKYGLRAYLSRIEQAVTKSLALPSTSVLKFNLDVLERGDSASRSLLYASYAQNGLRTRNELRELDDIESMPGADQLTVQSNLTPLSKLGKTPPQPPQPPIPPPKPGAEPVVPLADPAASEEDKPK